MRSPPRSRSPVLHTRVLPASVQVRKNEALYRAVNERIRSVSDRLEPAAPVEFICECSRRDCTELIALTLAEYSSVRERSSTFAVSPGHAWDDQRVVARRDAYWVVEKD